MRNTSHKPVKRIFDCENLPNALFHLNKPNLTNENTQRQSLTNEPTSNNPQTDTKPPIRFNQPPPQPPTLMQILYCIVTLAVISFAWIHADRALMYVSCIMGSISVAPEALKYIIPIAGGKILQNLPDGK